MSLWLAILLTVAGMVIVLCLAALFVQIVGSTPHLMYSGPGAKPGRYDDESA